MSLSVIPAADHDHTTHAPFGRSREIVIAAILVATFLTGVAAGRSLGPESGVPMTESQVSVPQPSQEFVYFPSQYGNQATATSEDTSTF